MHLSNATCPLHAVRVTQFRDELAGAILKLVASRVQMASPSSSPSRPSTPHRSRGRTFARKCERACCAIGRYFPLAFVYSLTTWAAYVEAGIGLRGPLLGSKPLWAAKPTSIVGIVLYLLLNASYTIAVFTDPGSPLHRATDSRNLKYSALPTFEPSHDPHHIQSVTVSSTGEARYCRKCQTRKPDRTHHCSTCRRCVLKMDHHCPWLATCVGLHNYKAFILFLVYTSLFCWICFASSTYWVWTQVFEEDQYLEEFAPVNIILLAVISGIIGLVLTGFTSWHLYLCVRGQTTIECLEKTRYLGAVRRRVERQRQDQLQSQRRNSSHGMAETLQRAGEQLLEFHANAIPGATRVEEGEERASPVLKASLRAGQTAPMDQESSQNFHVSPAQQALRRSYSALEAQRELDRFEEYEDDKESEKLPNAFDLGWRRNLSHLFGPRPLLWALPICNTTGDGWNWEVSPKWVQAMQEAARRRDASSYQTPSSRPQPHLRGGRGYGGTNDPETGYGHSPNRWEQPLDAISMDASGRPDHRQAKPKLKQDFDQAEVGGEVDHFEVSTDEDEAHSWQDQPQHEYRRTNDEEGWRAWE